MSNEKPDHDKSGEPDKPDPGGNGPKPVTIYVNTTAHQVKKDEVSYEEVVKLAFPDGPSGNNPGYTVLYQRGHGNKDGELAAGQSVNVKDGMSFDVTPTNLS